MNIITSLSQWRKQRQKFKSSTTIGFVPTMGSLHQGHKSLLKYSLQENDITVLSIFVNPTQFDNAQDYDNYPNHQEDDLQLAKNLGVDIVLLPNHSELYADNYTFKMTSSHWWTTLMEGTSRPGHFDGMLTIVLKLLLLVKPQKVYFGEKDYQQYQLVNELAKAYFLDCDIIACETIREKNGLPLSSRNARLSTDEKELAQCFANILFDHKKHPVSRIKQKLQQHAMQVDYVEKHHNRLFAAVKIGKTRLIDNFTLGD
ncbi:MAG: pantoate--beta-alanine ligase [Gammaproteobacteria bacterium]|nr:pantoate--beta-alanine ligase [Gammaproteobacteria bacterium]